ncbi:hypothetical protein SAMN05216276_107839 [Streptosporangium subroseum]|uniref:Uncharacterized protein n=1 Tax=Streptosporangium subroseum TaxID=106412 RepID=A0A239P0M2_9ACTN|nr:hypothetical protein [Streptosporangium subroseum]SNT60645.1 hypothetical protein SAMN05216276_107839 [Streptosporangium subroseum]
MPTPTTVTAEDRDFRQRVDAVLDAALADDVDATNTLIVNLVATYGGASLGSALLWWIHPITSHPDAPPIGTAAFPHAAATGISAPVTDWVERLIAARLDNDRTAFEQLLDLLVGKAVVREHVMGLLTLVTTHPPAPAASR